ncbi:cell adhesion molecule-related/down-regulated by oncogenes-like [Amphiura filiformis]|uniref:cell adhesion molecule-related/down-regulated by oncogenes-like n=1 Tax=Amphiura filiformis TaxID=82378 RepID=UPI003B213049
MEYYFNGNLIVENDRYRIMPSGSLHILDTNAADIGIYGCKAINPVTSRSREQLNATTLQLLEADAQDEAASIAIASGASVTAGTQAILECVPHGIPYPGVRWQKQGSEELPESATQRSGMLKILRCYITRCGVYECIAENAVGSPVVKEVTLQVIEIPLITKPPKTVSVGTGGAAEFKCGVIGATESDITWLHNAQPIPQDNPNYMVQIERGGVQLLVTDITRTELGVYQCIVRTNRVMDHAPAILKFREGFPKIIKAPINTTAVEGEKVVMSCVGSGDPAPTVRWTDPGGGTVVGGPRTDISVDTFSLTISDVGPTDQGWYKCTVNNRLGSVTADVYLAVFEKFTVTPTALPPARKTIGKPLSSDDGNMTVENTEEPQKPAVPDAPGKPEIFKTSETSVEVRWVYSGSIPVTRFTVEYLNIRADLEWLVASGSVDPSNRSYEVRNLTPRGTYRFRVIAGNSFGNSEPSVSHRFFLQASTPTVRPIRAPEGVVRIISSKAISSSTIEVIWEYTPDRINTPIDGYYIYHRDTDSDDDRDYIRTPVVGKEETRYRIEKLEEEVSYDIKMQSFNEGGTSSFSNVVIVPTPAQEQPITIFPNPVIPSSGSGPGKDTHGMPELPDSPDDADSAQNTQGQDILYITLGVVLGAMMLVLIMFGVMCIWRAKQVNNERITRMECDWRHAPYYDGSYRYVNTNGSTPHYKYQHVNGNMNGGPHHAPSHVYTQGIGHLPFGETATVIDPQPMYPLSQNGIDERTLMSNQSIVSNGHGPYPVSGEVKTVPMLPRTSSETTQSGVEPARSREGPLHSGSSSEHLQGTGSIRSYHSSHSGHEGAFSGSESGRTRSKRPKCPHRHHKADINKAMRRHPNEHPTSREGSMASSLDCNSVEVSSSPPPTPTSVTQLPLTTLPPPRSDGTESPHSRSRSSSSLSNASSCRNVKHSDIF